MNKLSAHPQALWLLALLPLVIALGLWANWRRRRDLARLASVPALAALVATRPARRRWRQLFLLLALLALIVGVAGPLWGRDAEQAVTQGRDLIVVLDLSRSMLAEQPNRQELARRALDDLADSLEKRGGHRIGLVVFAAQPKVVVPLTHDYDHFREAVARQDAAALPPELRPRGDEALSGTRIGAALKQALAAFDSAGGGFQDLLLVSDGDDPAGDEEWAQGTEEAKRKGIAIFTLGVGDPANANKIPGLTFNEQPVMSRLEEKPLQEIAQRTRGTYLAARRDGLPPGALYRTVLDSQGRQEQADAALPLPRPQYRWFFGSALVFLALGLLLGDGRRRRMDSKKTMGVTGTTGAMLSRPSATESHVEEQKGPRKHAGVVANMLSRPAPPQTLDVVPEGRESMAPSLTGLKSVHLRFGLFVVAVLLIGAATVVDDPDSLIRTGLAAFANEKYEAALTAFEAAEERTTDPGLVAFNKAATLFRLERYREAELGYVRCLEDRALPNARRARAWHDLGTTLLRQPGNKESVAALERAIGCFVHCLRDETLDPDLAASAEYNLELARLQWLKAKTNQPPSSPKENGPDPAKPDPPPVDDKNPPDKDAGREGKKGKTGRDKFDAKKLPGAAQDTPELKAGKGMDTLPDTDALQPLDREDAVAHLERAARRIEEDQRTSSHGVPRLGPNVKDW